MESAKSILTKIFTEYYLGGTQAKKEGKPIAYVTAFTPVEILRSMGLTCMYPESYAVVCAASKKAPDMIEASKMGHFAQDLCSYSLIAFGADDYPRLPYGGIPEPDLLIATNNQCGTTLLWFQLLAQKKNIPLFIIDYPAVTGDEQSLQSYIIDQYQSLIDFVGKQTKAQLDHDELSRQVACSRQKQITLPAAKIVDALFPIVVAKGTQRACDYYQALLDENQQSEKTSSGAVRLLWHGYPMWFLSSKFPKSFSEDFQVVLNDYTLWWNLDYGDSEDDMDALAKAYSGTYLNWPLERKVQWTAQLVDDYAIDGVVCHANRSCRRALADITPVRKMLAEKNIPSVVIESDMANPEFYSEEQVKLRIESFKDIFVS
jgi:benzoyl-CoA reductase/2-hydroxyglutaryl-CoA dehydratase subunit BcrC/BadD/HgdB